MPACREYRKKAYVARTSLPRRPVVPLQSEDSLQKKPFLLFGPTPCQRFGGRLIRRWLSADSFLRLSDQSLVFRPGHGYGDRQGAYRDPRWPAAPTPVALYLVTIFEQRRRRCDGRSRQRTRATFLPAEQV